MSKWVKRLLGLTAVAGVVAGVVYFFKKSDSKDEDLTDVFEDEDFDLDDDLKPVSDREYVPLTPNTSSDKSDDTLEEEEAEEIEKAFNEENNSEDGEVKITDEDDEAEEAEEETKDEQ